MTSEQVKDTILLNEKVNRSGVLKSHIAKMVGIGGQTLSRILSGNINQPFSKALQERLHAYLDGLNTNDEIKLK